MKQAGAEFDQAQVKLEVIWAEFDQAQVKLEVIFEV